MADTETAREKAIRLQRYSERKTILTLDLGAKTGWAISKGSSIYSGYWDVSQVKRPGKKYWFFHSELSDLIAINQPSFISYEKVQRHAGVYAAHAYGAYQGILHLLAEDYLVPITTMSVGEIKKFITGKGNADKQMVIDAVNKRGHNITDDNEADAVAMLYLQLSLMENQ